MLRSLRLSVEPMGGEEFVLAVELLFLRFHHLQLGARLLEQEHGVEPLRNHRGGRKALLGVLLERDVGGDLLQVAAEGVEFKLEPVRLCPSGGLHLRQTVALEGFGRGDLVMAVRNLVEFLQEEGVVAERLERLDFLFDGFDLLARAVVVEQDVLQFELIVAREGRDVAGLLVVVDDVVGHVVLREGVLLVVELLIDPGELFLEVGDHVVGLAETQVAVLPHELLVEQQQGVVNDAGIVVGVAHFEHVAAPEPLDLDLAQGVVAVMAVVPQEHAVNMVFAVALLVAPQIGQRHRIVGAIHQVEHLLRSLVFEDAVRTRGHVAVVPVGLAVG